MNDVTQYNISPARYPIGVQSFEDIRTRGFVYVDKTAILYKLVKEGMYYFLSRPRRFGKSLMLSTLKAYFEGRKHLFEGLAIAELEKDWEKRPVIHISLASGTTTNLQDARDILNDQIDRNAHIFDVALPQSMTAVKLGRLISSVREKFGKKVVVLVDEYDKPLLDTQFSNEEQYDAVHQELRGVYSCIKDLGEDIHFAMITGVTKFAQLNIFSGLNNLNDISLDDTYNAICGISQAEMDSYFADDIAAFAQKGNASTAQIRNKFKEYYDGYHFSGHGEDIYNPFSVLSALSKNKLDTYWYQSGNSKHLVEALLARPTFSFKNLEGYVATSEELMDANLSYTHPIALLYQTGFLTIKNYDNEIYTLGFPNKEVSNGFALNLMAAIEPHNMDSGFNASLLVKYALTGNGNGIMQMLDQGLKSFKYEQIEKPHREQHFHIMLHIMSMCAGLRVESEVHTSHGRIDMVIKTNKYIYIIEFKKDRCVAEALAQLKEKNYASKYDYDSREVIQIGANFSTETRLLTGWEILSCNQQ